MTDLVLREDRNGLTTLTLNRPEKLNSLNVEVFVELDAHLASIEKDLDGVGLVSLRGACKCFSAGHDLGDIAPGARPQIGRAHVRTPVTNAHVVCRILPEKIIAKA